MDVPRNKYKLKQYVIQIVKIFLRVLTVRNSEKRTVSDIKSQGSTTPYESCSCNLKIHESYSQYQNLKML